MSDSAARLAARYGSPRPLRRRLLVLVPVALLVAVALVYLLTVALRNSTPGVRWGLLGFEADGERGISVRWQVERDP